MASARQFGAGFAGGPNAGLVAVPSHRHDLKRCLQERFTSMLAQEQGVFRRGVSTMIGKGGSSFQLDEINGLKGSP
jgi:hypothetical protein